MEENHVLFHIKAPPLKAVYAESAIFHLKRKLNILMRSLSRTDWPNLVARVTQNANNARHKSLGYLRPSDLNSREKSVALDLKIGLKANPTFRDWEKNREKDERSGSLRKNDFVYVVVSTTSPQKAGAIQVKLSMPLLLRPQMHT